MTPTERPGDKFDRLLQEWDDRSRPTPRARRRAGNPSKLSKLTVEDTHSLVQAVKLGLQANGCTRKTKGALDSIIESIRARVSCCKDVKSSTLRRICFTYWDLPAPAAKALGQDRLQDALRDGPRSTKELVQILQISHSAVVSLTLKEKRAERIIAVGHGKFDLPRPGVKPWARANQKIIQILIDAPGHQLRHVELKNTVMKMGGGSGISMQLETLLRNRVIEQFGGGFIKLTAEVLEKIGRGATVLDGRGRVLWPPELKLPKVHVVKMLNGKDLVLDALRDGPRTTKELAKVTRLSHSAIATLTSQMKTSKKIVRVGHGKFALQGADEWRPASHVVIQALIDAPGHQMRHGALKAVVMAKGKSGSMPITKLRENGVIDQPSDGVVRLSSLALSKIKRGKAISDVRGWKFWAPLSAGDA